MGQSRDFGTDLEALNSPGHWDCPNCTDANTMGFISQSQRPKNLGQFQDFGTVPGLWDCPRTLGLSQVFGTVPGLWDCPRTLGLFQTSLSLFLS